MNTVTLAEARQLMTTMATQLQSLRFALSTTPSDLKEGANTTELLEMMAVLDTQMDEVRHVMYHLQRA